MALIINPSLPPGTAGLWWFAQGLENLGTAPTGSAGLGGSTYTAGKVVHDNVNDYTQLTADQQLLIPNGASTLTIMQGYQWSDTVLRGGAGFGNVTAPLGQRANTLCPWSDGAIYWDFGGDTAGSTRLSVAITKDTSLHVWGFTVGARGMEIWRDGTKIASNAAHPTVTTGAIYPYYFGRYSSGILSELGQWAWFFTHTTQLTESLIAAISADPAGTLVATSGGSGGAGMVVR